MRVIALIPAHNEEAGIAAALDALDAQTRPPDAVYVVSDNCTDATEAIVLAREDVGLIRTGGNRAKKAGALNQALRLVRDDLDRQDAVLVLDADSILAPDFLETACRYLRDGYSAVGGNFRGQDGAGFLGMCQRNEYARYARDVARLQGRALVLTGTATVFRFGALEEVARARGASLPGRYELIYDTDVLTEDNEMTFALRSLGHKVISPKGCKLTTEVMPTWRMLAKQRLRWKRGAFENLRQYGLNRLTAPYWARQALSALGVVVSLVYFASLAYALVVGVHLHPVWLALSLVFAVERAVTVRERGLRMALVGMVLLPEMVYDLYLQGVQAYAFSTALLGRKEEW